MRSEQKQFQGKKNASRDSQKERHEKEVLLKARERRPRRDNYNRKMPKLSSSKNRKRRREVRHPHHGPANRSASAVISLRCHCVEPFVAREV